MEKANLGFRTCKIWQILKRFVGSMVGSKNKDFLFFAFYNFFVFLQKIGSKKQKKNVDSKRMLILQFICKGFVIILKVLLKKWNFNMIFGDF